MKFLVFIKQVPISSEIQFDPANKTIIRRGVKNEINAYDRRALTEAIRYRNESGGEVIAATMGPPQAVEALKEALVMGVDSCIHIQDSSLAGSDTLVTAKVLAAVANKIGYDIILCGQHSTDSETGQVPVQLAELLGIPCATAVRKIEYLPDQLIQVTSETEEGSKLLEMPLPAVLTTAERLIKPLKTKNADLTTVTDEKIRTMNVSDLGLSPDEVGLDASPTWVADIINVSVSRQPEILDGSDAQATAQRILEILRSQKRKTQEIGTVPVSRSTTDGKSFWCWIEFLQSQVRPVSLEMLSVAASLASETGGSVSAMVAGPLNADVNTLLASHGADRIFHLAGTNPHPDEIVTVICERIESEKPFAIFFPATSTGKYLAPRIAARLKLGLTGDCVGLSLTDNDQLAQLKPAFGGNIVAPIFSRTFPQMATIRPGALETRSPRDIIEPEVIPWPIPEDVPGRFTIIAEEIDPGVEAVQLDHAKIVIGVGSGLGQDNVRYAKRLAELLDGSIAATRRVVDSGWLPRQFQVGLTGKFIAPDVYLSLGVSGRYNHMIGVQKSGFIIAVNQDPAAEIFLNCDIGVQGDCLALTTELIQILEKTKE